MKNKWKKKIIWYLILILLIALAGRFLSQRKIVEISPVEARAQEIKREVKQSTLSLENWIIKLEEKESGRRADIKILDVNGRYSYSCLQFQKSTLKTYALKFGLRSEITEKDMFDCSLQKQVAMAMIRDDYGNWRHWENSVLAIGLPPRD